MHVQASQWRSSFILTALAFIGLFLILVGGAAIVVPEMGPAWRRLAAPFGGVLAFGSQSVSLLRDIPLLTARRKRTPGSRRSMGVLLAASAAVSALNVVFGWLLL